MSAWQRLVADGGPDHRGEQFPVAGCRPGDVDELMDAGVRELVPDHPGHEVELIVVHHHERLQRGAARLLHDGVGELPVHVDVAGVPGVVDGGVDARGVGGTPHVVLEEPEQRVADDVVVLVVGAPCGGDEADGDALAGERGRHRRARARRGCAPVALSHGGGYPGEVDVVREPAQGGDDAAAAAPGLQLAVRADVVLHGTAVRHEEEALLLEQIVHERPEGGTVVLGCRRALHRANLSACFRPGVSADTHRSVTAAAPSLPRTEGGPTLSQDTGPVKPFFPGRGLLESRQ